MSCEDGLTSSASNVPVTVTDMLTSFQALTHEDTVSDAMLDTYVAETSVHAYFDTNDSVAGGPPAMISIYQGPHSLLSQATRPAVFQQMLSVSPVFEDDGHETLAFIDSFESSSDESDNDSIDVDVEVWHRLRIWSHEHHVSRDAMSELLLLFIDMGHDSWPRDWRTVINRLNQYDKQNDGSSQCRHASVLGVFSFVSTAPYISLFYQTVH